MTLTLIACDRFFGIIFAMKAHLTERRARTSIILVWVLSTGVSAPLLVYRKQFKRYWADHVEIWCQDNWPEVRTFDTSLNGTVLTYPSRTWYYTLVSLVLYFIPIVVMSIAYLLIIAKLWSSQVPGETHSESSTQVKNKRKVSAPPPLPLPFASRSSCQRSFSGEYSCERPQSISVANAAWGLCISTAVPPKELDIELFVLTRETAFLKVRGPKRVRDKLGKSILLK